MFPSLSDLERALNYELLRQPARYENRFGHAADCDLRQLLFRSLAGQRDDYLRYFFPNGPPNDRSVPWSLRNAQGAEEGAEYSAAAKGTACGHIFKNGESTYHCKTCAADDTCVLCAKCFESSDHEGHAVLISVSPGNSGCCDCGDREAWRREVHCSIHTADVSPSSPKLKASGKEKQRATDDIPEDLEQSIRMTIARCIDYLCDVFSCAPEQLRLPKTISSIEQDERLSRLGGQYGEEPIESPTEFALILWNDEKHTVDDVQNQIARACRKSKTFGLEKAMEINDVGRSVVQFSADVNQLLEMAAIIEHLKLTVTIRSARDTFREQMCATMIDWISDIAGCSVGENPYILRTVICEEFLQPWRPGSTAINKDIGQDGIDDHEMEDNERLRRKYRAFLRVQPPAANAARLEVELEFGGEADGDDNDLDDVDDEIDDEDYDDVDIDDMQIEAEEVEALLEAAAGNADPADMDVDVIDEGEEVAVAHGNARYAAAPAPPPSSRTATNARRRLATPADSDDGEADNRSLTPRASAPYSNVPRTPKTKTGTRRALRPSRHWLEKPAGFRSPRPAEPCEDLWQRVRLDFLILYDLRLWKVLRIQLRHLYITTVVTIPHFKRILGLRFAGLYTALAQLYLIADREPDHSIINLSVQMLTTPTITQEVVERGNFLTNLMAILYTFITTRQVGFPDDINPKATLAFEAGAVTNRRVFHFFLDLRWLFQSELIQSKMHFEPRYLLQFLDLVKLHQGVCPNVRAVGEHVEYESDAWISASLIVKEINKLCKQVAVSFQPDACHDGDASHLQRAIRTVAQVTMINSFGYERKRFQAAELKDDLAWHVVGPFDSTGRVYSVPKHVVQVEPMSFHHPLHYLLSWLLEAGKHMSRGEMRQLLHFSPDDLKDPWNVTRSAPAPATLTPDELLCAIFDHSLRVCVWLSQMKVGMWVRNGITLRHQAQTYRSVSHRDIGYQRDILIVQTGFVLCGTDDERPGERYLAQVINRFQLDNWIRGDYSTIPGFEEPQQIDVIEDFFHLLVITLSERGNLASTLDEKQQHDQLLQHDIAHALCFKPLSFSELSSRVTEKVGESDDFQRVLESMTNFRAPEGLSDTGSFELKPEFIELVDPYYAHYSRNYREEAEGIYRKHMARKTGGKAEDVIYEPRFTPITSGLYSYLPAFTATPLFSQIIAAAVHFALDHKRSAPQTQATRIETFLHIVLHLVLIAVNEDTAERFGDEGFVMQATTLSVLTDVASAGAEPATVARLLVVLFRTDEFELCHPAIKHILRKMLARQPERLASLIRPLIPLLDPSAARVTSLGSTDDKDRKKQEALARQARIMAKMKEQQNSFLQNQGLSDFNDEFDDLVDEDMVAQEDLDKAPEKKQWSFPSGTCILCQEETDDQRLYGTFAFLGESDILRSTPVEDPDYLNEVLQTPENLDRPADELRPFGVAGNNKQTVHKVTADGKVLASERQGLSKGFPHQRGGVKGPVATSCGHIMHYGCFDLYLQATTRRHNQQIARNHPERIEHKEFICPLCKALGNTFLPIIWRAKNCAREHELHATRDFSDWLVDAEHNYVADLSFGENSAAALYRRQQIQEIYSDRSFQYVTNNFSPSLMPNIQDLSLESSQVRYPLRTAYSLTRFLGLRPEGLFSNSTDPSPSSAPEQTRMSELWKAFFRIDESIQINHLGGSSEYDVETPNPVVSLSRALGLSVSAFEIAHRGAGSDPTAISLLADLPEQVLTHLRILSETIESYLAVNVLRSGSNKVASETIKKRDIMTAQLFGVESEIALIKLKELTGRLLVQDDSFLFFADWLVFMAPSVAEATSILQLCLWTEVVKTVYVLRHVVKSQASHLASAGFRTPTPTHSHFQSVVDAIGLEDVRDPFAHLPLPDFCLDLLRTFVDRYALTFCRKALVLMHVRYGLDYECPPGLDPELAELPRLAALLHIPSLDEMCAVYTAASAPGQQLRKITRCWLAQANIITEHEDSSVPQPITIPHPAIFELVGLPKNYDTLTEEATRRRCPTTGKEISDPAVCLLCGAIFCSQAVCCMRNNKGGCYQHLATHRTTVGVFVNIRKCMVLMVHGPGSGSYAHAPYLDKHGEPDPTLRRHHQLYLNQKRYDKLFREVWLQHLIPTVISRKLVGDINPGGWETL